MMMDTKDMFMRLGSLIATIMFIKAMFEQYIPYRWRRSIPTFLQRYGDRLVRFFSPYLQITFDEYTGEWFHRSKVYATIQTYLSENTSRKARRLKATHFYGDGKDLVLGLADNELVSDEFRGVTVWWKSGKHISTSQTIRHYPGADEKRYG
uniref:Adenosinetriphosphatase n=1 Tax=Opuntia streptacantha TaxID=393608 RepID=A0A7C9DAP8_OPUST